MARVEASSAGGSSHGDGSGAGGAGGGAAAGSAAICCISSKLMRGKARVSPLNAAGGSSQGEASIDEASIGDASIGEGSGSGMAGCRAVVGKRGPFDICSVSSKLMREKARGSPANSSTGESNGIYEG